MTGEDNVGEILCHAMCTISWSEHADIRYKYVNEYVEVSMVNILSVKFMYANSDILSKNIGEKFHI